MARRLKKYFGGFPATNISYGEIPGKVPRYTYGLSSPRTMTGMACLCEDELTYSRKCCKKYLINQGIGNITGVYSPYTRAFSNAFSDAFS
jgi:hypothetical protein